MTHFRLCFLLKMVIVGDGKREKRGRINIQRENQEKHQNLTNFLKTNI